MHDFFFFLIEGLISYEAKDLMHGTHQNYIWRSHWYLFFAFALNSNEWSLNGYKLISIGIFILFINMTKSSYKIEIQILKILILIRMKKIRILSFFPFPINDLTKMSGSYSIQRGQDTSDKLNQNGKYMKIIIFLRRHQ